MPPVNKPRQRNPLRPGRDTTGPSTGRRCRVDATKCIAACAASKPAKKKSGDVAPDVHRFPYLGWDGETARIEHPGRSGQRRQVLKENIVSPIATKMRRSRRLSSSKSMQSLHKIRPACGCPKPVRPTRPRMESFSSTIPIASAANTACKPVPLRRRFFNAEKKATDKCTWCYHRITKGLLPACVEVYPVGAARRSQQRTKRHQPVHPRQSGSATGNAPNCCRA